MVASVAVAAEEANVIPAPQGVIRPVMPELDTIRGLAVLLVVFFHGFALSYGLPGLSGIPRILVAATMPGWTGVNLFFVLSGFLITGILLDTKSRPDYYRRFYFRRALRILPLYYAVLLLLLIVSRTGLVHRPISLAFLALSFIYLSNVVRLFGVPPHYGVLWSLAVEEHFYLLWPLVVHKLSRRAVVVAALFICVLCPSLRALYVLRGYNQGTGYTWLVADGLAMGAVLAAVSRGPHGTRTRVLRFAVCALALSIGMFLAGYPYGIFQSSRFLGGTFRETALDLLFLGTIAGVLVLGTSSWKAILNRPMLKFFGKISYCIYLIHLLTFEVVYRFIDRHFSSLTPARGHLGSMVVRFCAGLAVTVVLACISRRYLEDPFLRLKGRIEN